MKYKLSKRADKDFKGIYKYTYTKFGEQQADKYTNSLEKCFLLLSEIPTIGRNVDYIKKGVLRHEHQEHTIFYRERKQDIFVVRILHEDMEPIRHL